MYVSYSMDLTLFVKLFYVLISSKILCYHHIGSLVSISVICGFKLMCETIRIVLRQLDAVLSLHGIHRKYVISVCCL